MKKILFKVFLLCVVLSLLPLSACKSTVVPIQTEDYEKPVSEQSAKKNTFLDSINALPDADYGGSTFRIATDHPNLIVPSSSLSVFGKTIYERNCAIEEKYNIILELTEESGLPTITDRIKTESLAGNSYCDFVFLSSNQFNILVNSSVLLNLRSIPFSNVNQNYYNQSSVAATTQKDATYGVCGDFTIQPDNYFAVFYNKDLLSQVELPDLYDMVNQNSWDIENFSIYSEEVYSIGRVANGRVYGFASSVNTENLVKVFWAASGQRYLNNSYGSEPYLDYNNETTLSFIQTASALLLGNVSYFSNHTNSVSMFQQGRIGFLIAPLSQIDEISGNSFDWGLLPMPKFDINQKNSYSYLENDYPVVGITKATENPEKSAVIISAFFLSSKDRIKELHIQNYLNFYLNSPMDGSMLNIILSSPYYDPVEFFGQGDPSNAYTASTHTLLYRVITAEGIFDKMYSQHQQMFENYLNKININ